MMDAKTFLSAAGPGKHWETEVIHIVTTNVSGNMQSWQATRECFVLGWQSSSSSNFHVYKNATPGTSLNTTAGVYNQQIWDGGAASANFYGQCWMFAKLVSGDILNFRTTTATQMHFYLFIGYLVPDSP